ncbi:MAG TPA: cyclic nucleotide-binding domain-containing protein [Candidatus Methylacidiphilales bacterium]|nr:cyclic nucleotide-binding domain-containing protein [Candidatus Methylacidiphilales bacterium]
MNPAVLQALSSAPFLTGLNAEALALLGEKDAVRDFAPGDIIVREGDAGHSLFIIMEGDVEVIKNLGAPHSALLARLHAGTFFGEMCVVDPVPRAATVRAISAVKVIEITSGTLHHLFKKMPDQYAIMILNVARDIARRLRRLDEAFVARSS